MRFARAPRRAGVGVCAVAVALLAATARGDEPAEPAASTPAAPTPAASTPAAPTPAAPPLAAPKPAASTPAASMPAASMPRSRVVVVWDREGSASIAAGAQRLIGELRGAGFQVTVVEHARGSEFREEAERLSTTSPGDDADTIAPFATIAVAPARVGVADVWVVDRLTQKTVVRHLESDDTPDTLAIRSAELLRASLLELLTQPGVSVPTDVSAWLGPLPARADAPAPPPHAAPKRRAPPPEMERYVWPGADEPASRPKPKVEHRAVMLGGGLAVLASYRGFSGAVGPSLDVRYRFERPSLELVGRVSMELGISDLQSTDRESGSATLRHGQVDLSLLYRLVGEDEPLRPAFGAGLGGYLVDVSGSSLVMPVQHHDALSFAPSLDADVELRFHPRVRGRIGVAALFLLPEPVVVIGGVAAGQAGEPLFVGTAGLSVAL